MARGGSLPRTGRRPPGSCQRAQPPSPPAGQPAPRIERPAGLTEDGRSFQIRPAVRFLRVAGDEADPNGLVETVQDERALQAMGADVYMDSVILGDTAYDVQPGFLGDPLQRTASGGG